MDLGWSSQKRKEKKKGLNISGYQQMDNYAREGKEVLLILAHVIVHWSVLAKKTNKLHLKTSLCLLFRYFCCKALPEVIPLMITDCPLIFYVNLFQSVLASLLSLNLKAPFYKHRTRYRVRVDTEDTVMKSTS